MACVSLRSLYILNIQSVLRCLLEFFSSNDRIPQVRGWPATPSWRVVSIQPPVCLMLPRFGAHKKLRKVLSWAIFFGGKNWQKSPENCQEIESSPRIRGLVLSSMCGMAGCMKIMKLRGKIFQRKKNCVTHGAVPFSRQVAPRSFLVGQGYRINSTSHYRGWNSTFVQSTWGSNPYPTHPGQDYDSLYYILISCSFSWYEKIMIIRKS